MATNSESLLSKISTPFFSEGATVLQTLYDLWAADERTGEVLKTIRHITLNVENVRRLRRLNAGHLSTRDLDWIDALISDTEDAIGGLGKLVERARVDKETKEHMSLWNRGLWVGIYSPQVKEKYAKLTMCHQSLLSVFPFLFNNHAGLASVLEDTKEDDQQPYDPTMTKWLGWQDQRQRRKSTISLRRAVPPRRPMSVSSGSTGVTSVSGVSSNDSASTRPSTLEALSPRSAGIGIPCYPATYPQFCSPTSASISSEAYEAPSGIYNKNLSCHSRKPLQSCGSPDLAMGSLCLTYPVFNNNVEDNYDPPSALPEHDTEQDDRNDDIAPTTKPSNVYDGADGLQAYTPSNGSGFFDGWDHQLHISPSGGPSAGSSKETSIERSSDSNVVSAEAIKRGREFTIPPKADREGNQTDTEQKATLGPSLHLSNYPPPSETAISRITSSVAGLLSELQSLNALENGAERSLEGKKPPIDRAHSDSYAPGHYARSRPGVSPSGRVPAASEGSRSISAGQRVARRGSQTWLAFHSSRSDLSRRDGWGDG